MGVFSIILIFGGIVLSLVILIPLCCLCKHLLGRPNTSTHEEDEEVYESLKNLQRRDDTRDDTGAVASDTTYQLENEQNQTRRHSAQTRNKENISKILVAPDQKNILTNAAVLKHIHPNCNTAQVSTLC